MFCQAPTNSVVSINRTLGWRWLYQSIKSNACCYAFLPSISCGSLFRLQLHSFRIYPSLKFRTYESRDDESRDDEGDITAFVPSLFLPSFFSLLDISSFVKIDSSAIINTRKDFWWLNLNHNVWNSEVSFCLDSLQRKPFSNEKRTCTISVWIVCPLRQTHTWLFMYDSHVH